MDGELADGYETYFNKRKHQIAREIHISKGKAVRMTGDRVPITIGMIINQYTKAFLKRSRGCIRVVSLISELSFEELIDEEFPESEKIEVEFKKKVHQEYGFVLWNYTVGREVRGKIFKGSFLALQVGSFVFLITGHSPSFVRKCILYIARQMYPDIMIAYITAEEIYEILQNLAKAKEVELLYSKYVAKKVFGKRHTSLGYAHAPFTEAFKKARDSRPRLWIDSIRVFTQNGTPIDFYLSREGYLVYYKGNFEEYYEHILVPIKEYCSRRLKVFEKRGRRETINKEPRPLLIQYESKVFEDPSVRKQLINVIANYDFCNFSVIHQGNPHVYLNIVDRIDNSTFSLRTYGSDSLIISPQIKTSKASLMRFSKHLLDNFLEGKVSEFNI